MKIKNLKTTNILNFDDIPDIIACIAIEYFNLPVMLAIVFRAKQQLAAIVLLNHGGSHAHFHSEYLLTTFHIK